MEGAINTLLLVSSLFLTGTVAQFQINECGIRPQVEIVKTSPQTSLTCSGLDPTVAMYWLIDLGSGGLDVLSNCKRSLSQSCGECLCPDGNFKEKFNMTLSADGTESTLYFNDLPYSHNTTFYCKQSVVLKGCRVLFIDAQYKLDECQNNSTDVIVNQGRNITCSGMVDFHNMYWILAFKNGTERRIDCLSTTSGTACNPSLPDAQAYRYPELSVLTVQDRNGNLDGAVVTCSQLLNQTKDQCRINVILPYKLRECQNHATSMPENGLGILTLTCENLLPMEDMYWTVRYANGTTLRIDCQWNSTCETKAGEVYVIKRVDSKSVFNIQAKNKELDGAVFTCSSADNATSDYCQISVILPDGNNNNQPSVSTFPIVAVAVGVVVAVVVIIILIIIIVVVVVKKRGSFARSKSSTDGPVWLNLGANSDGPDSPDYYNVAVMASPLPESEVREENSGDQNYSPLELSDVGQRSVYSQLSPGADNSTTESEAKQDATYSDLDLSQVGQSNVYTELNK